MSSLSSTLGHGAGHLLPQRVKLASPWWVRASAALAEAWRGWAAERQRRRQIRLLRTLEPRLLKDMGLGEFAAEASPRWPDWYAANW
jgi:uncharacterized protein YjiS (DUF1127 family)